MTVLLVLAVVTAASAAVRSTWSPCGISMLSSITPLSERGRGHRFGATATWFTIGAVLGGLALGAVAAVGAALIGALAIEPAVVLGAAAAAALVTLGFDARAYGPALPHHRRQVNEVWLDQYRAWVYGAGFGVQIGSGLATYIMTAAVYLTIVLAALTGSAVTALGIGALFGAVRGSMVWWSRSIATPAELSTFHRRFDELGEPTRRALIAVQAAVVTVAALASGRPGVVVAFALGLAAVATLAVRGNRRHVSAACDLTTATPTTVSTAPAA